MNRPWQRRQGHLKQAAAECIEALAGTIAAHLANITPAEAQYLAAVEQWARGEMGAQKLAAAHRSLGHPRCCGLADLIADVGAHPTHLQGRVSAVGRWLVGAGVPAKDVLDTYEARRRECLRASLAAAMAAPASTPDPIAAELRAAGWSPSPVRDGWWRDATASGDDYPAARALFLARRDRARTSPQEPAR